MNMGAIERAYALARTGQYENFTGVKKALRREFNVDRELVGRALGADITRICREQRQFVLRESAA